VNSGVWVVGLARHLQPEDRPGRAARPFSRIEFDVEVDGDQGSGAITCRATAFDRDLPARLFVFRAGQVKDDEADALAEERYPLFAQGYGEARGRAAGDRAEAEVSSRAVLN